MSCQRWRHPGSVLVTKRVHLHCCAQDTFKLPQLEAYDTNTENILTTRFQPGPFNGCTFEHRASVPDCMAPGNDHLGVNNKWACMLSWDDMVQVQRPTLSLSPPSGCRVHVCRPAVRPAFGTNEALT